MALKESGFTPIDWQQTDWQQTPSVGVFISLIHKEPDSEDPHIPKYTVMAVRVDPQTSIPLHRHIREHNWIETLTFPQGGNFEIHRTGGLETFSGTNPITIKIGAGEAFGLKNNNSKEALYFVSRMEPGFTGYEEIEEVK